jgi:two-component system chemotaxis response regulator CheY
MSLSILAVDDSRTIRDMLSLALRQAGFSPSLAEDGMHGLEVLNGMTPDAIITDINMPRMDGFGFIEAVRSQPAHRTTPILVLTTESAPQLKARARSAGATGWIVKPFDPEKLVRALTMVAGPGGAR